MLSASEIGALFERPATVAELLKNLKLAWDQKLLVQPAFFEDSNLLKFFSGKSVRRETPGSNTKNFRAIAATVIVDDTVFPGETVTIRWNHERVVLPANLPASRHKYAHDTGWIRMDVESLPSFSWGAVKEVFGPNARDVGVHTYLHGEQTSSSLGKVDMQYLYPGENPAKKTAVELSATEFVTKQGPVPEPKALPPPGFTHTVQDTDTVKSVYIFESVKR